MLIHWVLFVHYLLIVTASFPCAASTSILAILAILLLNSWVQFTSLCPNASKSLRMSDISPSSLGYLVPLIQWVLHNNNQVDQDTLKRTQFICGVSIYHDMESGLFSRMAYDHVWIAKLNCFRKD